MTSIHAARYIQTRTSATSGSLPRRNPELDAYKFILVTLVTFGHFLARVREDNEAANFAYYMLSFFRMPALVLISGYMTSSGLSPSKLRRLFEGIILPYLLFSILYYTAELPFRGSATFDLLSPSWLLWYLLSLFVWRIAGPYFNSNFGLAAAFISALLSGLVDEIGLFLSMGRTIYFFPIFLLGMRLKRLQWTKISESLRRPMVRLGAGTTMALLALVTPIMQKIDISWFWGTNSYSSLGFDSLHGVGLRIALLTAGVLGAFSFFSLLPRSSALLAPFGVHSMAPYLLHGFVVKGLSVLGLLSLTPDGYAGVAAILFLSISVALLFSNKVCSLLCSPGRWLPRRSRSHSRGAPIVSP